MVTQLTPRAIPRDAAAAHRFVTSDGTGLYVRESGDPDADVTVLFLHGWVQDHTCWDRVVDQLPAMTARPIRVLRHDHRGHGGSAPARPGTTTIEQLASDTAELIADRVPRGKLVLVGHSMGGATIMDLVGRYPELVERLAGVAFVATTSGGLSELTFGAPRVLAKQVTRAEKLASKRFSRVQRPTLLRRTSVLVPIVRRMAFGAAPDRAEVVSTARQIGRAQPAGILSFLDSLLVHERSAELDALAETPCVILSGARDKLCPPAHSRVISDRLPDAEYVHFPGAGHMLGSERSTEVAARIANLVD